MQEKNIVIGGAWPYANSDLHLGHIAGLISGDVLARYFRAKGYNVVFVSGTDCHGTPITERAKKEHKSPKEIAEYYDKRDRETLSKFNFSYDLYTNTDTDFHRKEVMEMFKKSMIMDIFMKKLNHNHIAKIVKNSYLIERFKLHVQNVELKQKLNNVMDVNMYQLLMI